MMRRDPGEMRMEPSEKERAHCSASPQLASGNPQISLLSSPIWNMLPPGLPLPDLPIGQVRSTGKERQEVRSQRLASGVCLLEPMYPCCSTGPVHSPAISILLLFPFNISWEHSPRFLYWHHDSDDWPYWIERSREKHELVGYIVKPTLHKLKRDFLYDFSSNFRPLAFLSLCTETWPIFHFCINFLCHCLKRENQLYVKVSHISITC